MHGVNTSPYNSTILSPPLLGLHQCLWGYPKLPHASNLSVYRESNCPRTGTLLLGHYTRSGDITFSSQDAVLCGFIKKLKFCPLSILQILKDWREGNEKHHSEPRYPNYLVKAVTRGMSGTFERVLGVFSARGKPMLQQEANQL